MTCKNQASGQIQKKGTASYLFLVPHHSIFYFGSHLHFPSPGLGHLRLKTHSERERQRESCVSDAVMRREGRGLRSIYQVGRCVMTTDEGEGEGNTHTHNYTDRCVIMQICGRAFTLPFLPHKNKHTSYGLINNNISHF